MKAHRERSRSRIDDENKEILQSHLLSLCKITNAESEGSSPECFAQFPPTETPLKHKIQDPVIQIVFVLLTRAEKLWGLLAMNSAYVVLHIVDTAKDSVAALERAGD